MSPLIPIPVIAVTVTLLIWAALRGDDKQVYLWKPLSTLLVILVALLSFTTPGVKPAYTWGIDPGAGPVARRRRGPHVQGQPLVPDRAGALSVGPNHLFRCLYRAQRLSHPRICSRRRSCWPWPR